MNYKLFVINVLVLLFICFGTYYMMLMSSDPMGEYFSLGCTFPKLELWTPYIKSLTPKLSKLNCSSEEDWVIIKDAKILFTSAAAKDHGKISCDYTPFYWKDDFSVQ